MARDDKVQGCLNCPIERDSPYLWIDATCVKVRQNNRIVSVAAIIAVAVNSDGRREVLGLDIGASEASRSGPLTGLARPHQGPRFPSSCSRQSPAHDQPGHARDQGEHQKLPHAKGHELRSLQLPSHPLPKSGWSIKT